MQRIAWSTEAEAFLLTVAPSDADLIFDAVEQMATARRGFVRDMLDGAGTFGLYLPGFLVLFHLDEDGTVRVDRVRHLAGQLPGHETRQET